MQRIMKKFHLIICALLAMSMTITVNSLVYAEWASVTPPNVSSNWDLRAIHFTSINEGWAVGADYVNQKGVLLHYSSGSWASVNPPNVSSDWYLTGVHFISSDEGWAVGVDQSSNQKGVLLYYINGSWSSVAPPSVGSNYWELNAVYFISPNEGWAVGGYDQYSSKKDQYFHKGLLLHYNNGVWVQVSEPNTDYLTWGLRGVHFTSPNEGWAVGYKESIGALLHYSNSSWSFVNPPNVSPVWNLMRVYFTSSTEGWAVGSGWWSSSNSNDKGVLLHYSKGAWASVSPPDVSPYWSLWGVHFTSSNEGWGVGGDWSNAQYKVVLLRYTNGSWIEVNPSNGNSNGTLMGVYFTSPDEGWAVGYDESNKRGVLLKYYLPCSTPGTPSNPTPAIRATGVSTNPTLSWPACANTDSYDVYFGTSSSPPHVGNTTNTSYSQSGLSYNTLYYWKIVAKNNCGNSTSGSVWSFTTGTISTINITVTSPNGGENWKAGTTQTISWTYTGNPGKYVKIELLKGDSVNRTIAYRTSIGSDGNGSYSWRMFRFQTIGSAYKIRVTSFSNSSYTDTSDNNFTISK